MPQYDSYDCDDCCWFACILKTAIICLAIGLCSVVGLGLYMIKSFSQRGIQRLSETDSVRSIQQSNSYSSRKRIKQAQSQHKLSQTDISPETIERAFKIKGERDLDASNYRANEAEGFGYKTSKELKFGNGHIKLNRKGRGRSGTASPCRSSRGSSRSNFDCPDRCSGTNLKRSSSVYHKNCTKSTYDTTPAACPLSKQWSSSCRPSSECKLDQVPSRKNLDGQGIGKFGGSCPESSCSVCPGEINLTECKKTN